MNKCEQYCRTIKRMANAGSVTPTLPPEYQQVEYICGNTCYINPNISNQIPIEFECEAKSYNGGAGYILGSYEQGARFFVQLFTSAGKTAIGYGGTYASGNSISRQTYYKISGTIHDGSQTLFINDVQYINSTMTGAPRTRSIYLFGCNSVDGTSTFNGEMKYLRIWSNNTLLFNGIPCYRKSDNRAGFYDTVSGQLFETSSTGNFGVGPAV